MSEDVASRDNLTLLMEGRLPADQFKALVRLKPKDKDRFWKYLEVLQSKVTWKDRILLPISDHLYVVGQGPGKRVVKCDCGQEFGDFRANWKLACLISVRRTEGEMREIFTVGGYPDLNAGSEIREFYCPGCLTLLCVESCPRGYPVIFDFLPDIDSLYRDWLGSPLPDESPEWYDDRTVSLVQEFAGEKVG